jgi:hypothetical protein
MKKFDQLKKDTDNVQITISAPKILIADLEAKAKAAGTTPSRVVAHLLRKHVIDDRNFHSAMAAHHAGEMQKHLFMKEQKQTQMETEKEVRSTEWRY